MEPGEQRMLGKESGAPRPSPQKQRSLADEGVWGPPEEEMEELRVPSWHPRMDCLVRDSHL